MITHYTLHCTHHTQLLTINNFNFFIFISMYNYNYNYNFPRQSQLVTPLHKAGLGSTDTCWSLSAA